MDFNIVTLGCKVNQYESQAMREAMIREGFEPSADSEKADITIINSCTVTSVSDAKNRKAISRSRRNNPDGIVVLTGCMPQAFPKDDERFAECDIVLGNAKRAELVPAIQKFLEDKKRFVGVTEHTGIGTEFENLSVSSLGNHTRAFVKIEDGCNRFCSYCIIPYARGRVRSKHPEILKREVQSLVDNGYKEVVLVGINLSSYGLLEDFDITDAVEWSASVYGLQRVRLGSLEPEKFDERKIKLLHTNGKFCPQFHLSLQSGCDKTLINMNRHYSTKQYMEIVNNIRFFFNNPSITTDIMVGFPGETQEDFEKTIEFAEKVGFAKIHVFPYSVRKGTEAAKYKLQVRPEVKAERAKIMGDVAARLRRKFLLSQVGKVTDVLIEQFKRGYLEGYSANYTPVLIESQDIYMCGTIRQVKIIEAFEDYCVGVLV